MKTFLENPLSSPTREPESNWPFTSPRPRVRLVKAFTTPFANVVATARTCYSKSGIVLDDPGTDKWKTLARDLYKAGHHTTFQHAHFQFSIENVSRQFIWSFLHSHPFYNSEQVSQRYVRVDTEQVVRPRFPEPCDRIYEATLRKQSEAYHRLVEDLIPLVRREYMKLFPNRNPDEKKHRAAIRKKAMEAARYVLPVGTFAYLYHTVSGITLLRYARCSLHPDTPAEQREVVRQMVEQLLEWDPDYESVLEEPIPTDRFPEWKAIRKIDAASCSRAKAFVEEFDQAMVRTFSALVGWENRAEDLLADAVREVLGTPKTGLSAGEAAELVLSPAGNPVLGEHLNLTTHTKLERVLFHVHYTFRKRLSHTADSQNQRHRMTPGSRPILAAHYTGEPDYIRPGLVETDGACRELFDRTMKATWQGINELLERGAEPEKALYLLPNAVTIRFTESADLLNLRHKHAMRLCYNAQEEIWRASLEEAEQIRKVHPSIGRWLLPPCGHRSLAHSKPICPEGVRYCGVPVWKLDLSEYERVL